jgi:hypothetical protein
MGVFSKRPFDEFKEWERIAVKEFARAGRRGQVIHDPDDPFNTSLVTDVGTFGFANLYVSLRNAPPRDRVRLARAHVASIVHVEEPNLDDDRVLDRLRARLMPSEILVMMALEYARPFAPGLIEVLCVDQPHTVQVLGDAAVAGRDLDSLWSRGRSNLRFESFERTEIAPSITFLEGPSLFVASLLLRPGFAENVIGPAPLGWVFAVPDRHTLAFHVVLGSESVEPISRLAEIMGSVDRDSRPGAGIGERVLHRRPGDATDLGDRCRWRRAGRG